MVPGRCRVSASVWDACSSTVCVSDRGVEISRRESSQAFQAPQTGSATLSEASTSRGASCELPSNRDFSRRRSRSIEVCGRFYGPGGKRSRRRQVLRAFAFQSIDRAEGSADRMAPGKGKTDRPLIARGIDRTLRCRPILEGRGAFIRAGPNAREKEGSGMHETPPGTTTPPPPQRRDHRNNKSKKEDKNIFFEEASRRKKERERRGEKASLKGDKKEGSYEDPELLWLDLGCLRCFYGFLLWWDRRTRHGGD